MVLLSAFLPTLIAQQLFQPELVDEEEEEALGAEDVAMIGHRAPVPRAPVVAGGKPGPEGGPPGSTPGG